MTSRLMMGAVFAATSLALFASLMIAQSADSLFRDALVRQTAGGDITGAIPIYERILRNFPNDRPLAARTLVQLGKCYEALDQRKSKEYFDQVITKYSDQPQMVMEARAHLALEIDVPVEVATPVTDDPFGFAISPDGRKLVFAVTRGGRGQLWLHDFNSGKPSPISGADVVKPQSQTGSSAPFWSPDGRTIGYFSNQKLKRIPAVGGTAQTLADAPSPAGGTWNRDNVILFTPAGFGLYRINSDGTGLAKVGSGRHSHPQFLADGKHFLYYVQTSAAAVGQVAQVLHVASLDTFPGKPLSIQAHSGVFGPPDRVFFATDAGLYSQRLDMETFALTGTASALLEHIAVSPATGIVAASASISGRIAYRSSAPLPERQFVWLDRQGQPAGPSFLPDPGNPCCARISPDGRRIVFGRSAGTGPPIGSLWTVSNESTAQPSIFSTGAQVGVWSTGGTLLIGHWRPQKPYENLVIGVLWRESDDAERPTDWSHDGGFIMYEKVIGGDLIAIPAGSASPRLDGTPVPIASTSAEERNGRFSPNGRWVAYQSNELKGQHEIFVQPFPGSTAERRKVSINGGVSPVWRDDGREIFFLSLDYRLMSSSVTFDRTGKISVGSPTPVFPAPLPIGSEYDTLDGQHFLINRPTSLEMSPIIVSRSTPEIFAKN